MNMYVDNEKRMAYTCHYFFRRQYMTNITIDSGNQTEDIPVVVNDHDPNPSLCDAEKKDKNKKARHRRTKSIATQTETDHAGILEVLAPYKDTVRSISKNIKTWIFFAFSIAIVARENIAKGMITFFVMLFLVYWVHFESHAARNWFTISHHYHHENNNWFSHGIQILMEMQFGLLLPILNEFLMDNILDKWVIILLYIFYTSVHNINYSLFHVNRIHELHHDNIFTNIGPDICDVMFDTKNQDNVGEDDYLEDTGHYILNIIIGTILVVGLKKLCRTPITKMMLDWWSYFVLVFITVIIIASNTYLMNHYH